VEESDRQTAADGDNHDSPGIAFREAMSQVGELKEYALHDLSARLDALKLSIRHAVVWVAIGALTLLATLVVIITAIVILCVGLAQTLAAAMGGRMWAGNLIVGAVLVGGTVLFIWMCIRKLFALSLSRTVGKYDRKLRRERVELGHDAQERSTQQDAEHD
jgi:hypothetical protein